MFKSLEIHTESSRRLEFLDGLRGIAALAVIFFHFNGTIKDHGIEIIPSPINFLAELGHYGVQIFFVLSGFVIAYSLRNEWISPSFCGRFFLKRSLRLDPPYWAVIGLMLLLNILGNVFFDKKGETLLTPFEVLMNLLYAPDFLQIPRILPVSWTLALELQFYLFFVVLLMFAQRFINQSEKQKSWLFHLIFASVMILSLLQSTPWALVPSIPGFFLSYWYSFFIGCATCWVVLRQLPPSLFCFYLVIIGCMAMIQESYDFLAVLGVALTITAVFLVNGMHCFLSSRFIQYTGKISYTLYLIHWPVGMKCIDIGFRFFGDQMNHFSSLILLTTLSLGLTFLAAHCFYLLVEQPSLKWSKAIRKKRDDARGLT